MSPMATFINSQPATAYLFDTYPFAHAYSLRKLKSSATSAIRVRRASDSSEQDIGFVDYDLDTASLATFCSGTSGFVAKWYDQGSTLDLVMSTAANQPRIYDSGAVDTKGSEPCLNFISSDYLEAASSMSILNAGNNYSFYTVSSVASTETFGAVFCTSGDATGYRLVQFCDARTTPSRNVILVNTSATSFFSNLASAIVSTSQRYLSAFITSAGAMSGYANGTAGSTATYTGTYTNNKFLCGVQHNGNGYITGQIQEMIFYSSDTSSDRTGIESDITTWYGL